MSTDTAAPAATPVTAPSLPASDNLKDLGAAWAAAPDVPRETAKEPVTAADVVPDEVKATEGQSEAVEVTEGQPEAAKEPVAEEQKRDEAGKFVKLITVEHNGVKYDLPPDLPLQFKVNGEFQTKPLTDILRANSAEGAVSQAKEDARLAIRGAKAEIAAAKAEADTIRGVLKQIRETPALADRILSDPDYAALFDETTEARVRNASLAAMKEASTAGLDMEYAQQAVQWIQQTALEYPGVDPEEVRAGFAHYLTTNEASRDPKAFTPERVRTFFEKAQGKVKSVTGPLEAKLAEQAKELAELKAALKGNLKTEKVLERAKTPPVGQGGPGISQAGSTVSAVRPDGSRMNLRDASEMWGSTK